MLYERAESLTRLVETAAEAVGGSGRVVLVRGEAGIGKTALVRSFLQDESLRSLIGRCDDAMVPLVLGPFRDIFAQKEIPLSSSDASDPRERIDALLKEVDCIVIEDLHWADEATLDLVSHLGRRITETSVVLVITARPTEDSHVLRCLAQLPTEAVVDLALGPLSPSAVETMSRAAGRSGEDIFTQSGGNPFLITEILASPEGVVPMRVLDSTLARMSDQSAAANEMAQLLSVFPSGASWTTLERLRSDVTAVVDELERGAWLELSTSRVGFRHELLRRAVEESLSNAVRRQLNSEVLEVLLASEAEAAALAHHAEQAGETRVFLEQTVVAAREFARAGAHRDALTHLKRVEQHSSLLPTAEQARFAEALGEELTIGDRPAEARQAFLTAAGRWERLGDHDSQARALSRASTAAWWLGDMDRSLAELQLALALLTDSNGRDLVVQTRVSMAQKQGMLSRWPTALAQVDEVMDDARHVGGEALVVALGVRGNARRILGDRDGGRSDQNASIELALRIEGQSLAMTGYTNRVAASLGTLDLTSILDEIEEALSYSNDIESESARFRLDGHRCYLRLLQGDWDQALRSSARLRESGGSPVALIRPRLVEGIIRARRGDDSGLALILEAHEAARATQDIQRIGPTVNGLAEMQWLELADSSAEIVDAADLARSSGHVRHIAELSLWCRRLGLESPDPPAKGPPHLLSELSGDWAAAADGWKQMGLPHHRALAIAFSDDADAMREAIALATRLGASTVADRIRARLRSLGHRVGRGPGRATLGNPASLTNRQIDVVKLLALGLTNREIADRLFISPKTVDHHVSAILDRIGVSDRQAAGAWARKQGLADSPPNGPTQI